MTKENILPSLLLLIFITLKLCHVIDWSWWWVLSPLWITIVIAIILISAVLIFYTYFKK